MNASLVLAADGVAATAAGAEWRRPSLLHCLLLAALLHLWLVALVGTTPGGSARPGEGVWSTIQIRLGGAGPSNSPGRADSTLPNTGQVGRAPEPRFGGTVLDAAPLPSPEPGAAELGVWSARPSPNPLRSPAAPAQAQADPAPALTPPPVLTRREPLASERREDRSAPVTAAPALPEPPPRPAPEATPAPSTAPRLAPADTVEMPVLERPPLAQRDIAHPAPAPAVVARPMPSPAPQRDEPVATPQATPQATPSVTVAPVATVPAPSAPVAVDPQPRPTAPSEVVPAIEPVPRPLPPPVVVPPAPALAPATPPAPQITPAAPLPPALRPIDATQLPRVAAPELVAPVVRSADPAPTAGPASTTREPAAGLPAGPTGGQPAAAAAVPRQGVDRATPPPSAAASTPRLNLELPRARPTLPGLAAPRVLNLLPPPPERKSTLSEGIEKAAKADCRKAYAGMGLLAVVPLTADAAREAGCRW